MKQPIITMFLVLSFVFSLSAQVNWTKYANNPILPSFDSKVQQIYDQCILLDHGTYKMWYTRKYSETEKIAYATSTDGVSWTVIDTAVLVAATKSTTRFDFNKVGQPAVIQDGDTLKMWYWGDGPNIGNIGLAWSINGRSWTRVDGPNSDLSVFDRTADGTNALAVVTPCVIKIGSTYHMWYTRIHITGTASVYTIAYATSSDGIHWSKVSGTGSNGAVIDLGTAGSFDENLVVYPNVLPTASGFEMWYSARDNQLASRIGYATSTDGIHWTKVTGSAPEGSVLDMSETCSVIKEGSTYKMWYMYYNTEMFYATSSGTNGVPSNNGLPLSYQLYQNYPNPFNPETTIKFQIGNSGLVKLKVYDILGHEVAILVNEVKKSGTYGVQWKAKNFSSGVYFYKLTTGNYTLIKKMSLIK